jgi:UDP-glucose 4-epimerase
LRVLVTGASGFVGRHVAHYLQQNGHTVVGQCRSNVHLIDPGLHTWWAADLCARDIDWGRSHDAIVHCAATHPVSGVSVAKTCQDNVAGTTRLVEMARKWGVKAFIFMSSISVYGKVCRPVLDEPTQRIDPDSYGETKHLCEQILREQPFPTISLRLPGILGLGAHEKRNWIPRAARLIADNKLVSVFNLDKPFNAAAHVDDISKFVDQLLGTKLNGHDEVLVAASGETTVRGAVSTMGKRLGKVPTIQQVSDQAPAFLISSRKAVDRYGYVPTDIMAMLEQYAAEFFLSDAADRA